MRRWTIRTALVCILAVGLSGRAMAVTYEGVTIPDTYTVDGRELVLNGLGLRTLTIFHVHVYVAALYTAHPSHDAAQILASQDPKVLVLHFIHSGSKDQIEKEYREGEANNCGAGECSPSDRADFERLIAAAPAVGPGDTSTFVFHGDRVRVYANADKIADFKDGDLGYHLLGGFIGKHPPSEALRNSLLGLPAE